MSIKGHHVLALTTGSIPVLTTISYLIPGSIVTTIGIYSGKFREWGRKRRETYNGGVPKTMKRDIGAILCLTLISTTLGPLAHSVRATDS